MGAEQTPIGPYQPWRFAYRLPALALAGLVGLPILMLALLPGLRDVRIAGLPLGFRVQRRYARILLFVMGMRFVLTGTLPPRPFLLVANHISWFDIPLLHAAAPLWLVAKHDIRGWPMVGWLARAVGTIFIERGSDGSRRRVARRMTALLQHGRIVGIFPEGGIQPARGVGRFHARLFGAAVRSRTPVVPVAIRYWRDGDLHDERVFGPGTTFLGLLMSNIARPPCQAQVIVGSPIDSAGRGRSELARESQSHVARMYNDEPSH